MMVGEILHGTFTLKNNSEIDLQYGISLLSEKSDVVQAFSGPSEIGEKSWCAQCHECRCPSCKGS